METEAAGQQTSLKDAELTKHKKDSIFCHPISTSRKSFQLEDEDNQPNKTPETDRSLFSEAKSYSASDLSRCKISSHNPNEKHTNNPYAVGKNNVQKPSLCHPLNFSSQCTQQKNSTTSKPSAKLVLDVTKVGVSAKTIHQCLHQQHDTRSFSYSDETKLIEQSKEFSYKPWTSTPRKSKIDSSCCDLFGDDGDDDDLLCAIAEEVESRYGMINCLIFTRSLNYIIVIHLVTSGTTKLDDDDGFFQPEVLAFISQIECK